MVNWAVAVIDPDPLRFYEWESIGEGTPSFEEGQEPGAISLNILFCQPFDLIEENCIENLGGSDERFHRGADRGCR